ncbi:Sau3AI family type II restriction endonuclease [Clostridium tunisiense]|uniref:Sau3AI family type II restriction endonuclease n=1 Tax=Clostridium tunisiense TaxID=219748 RepID=UPI0002F44D1C|nr:Sau3AI family type II restriction endonuclease [Clostridium tunisiense]
MRDKKNTYETQEELMIYAKGLEGKTFGEIDKTNRIVNEKAKGKLGQIIEESYFGYEINSKPEADFKNLNIELKVTPYKKNKNGSLSAKERLVLNIINYMEEIHKDFYTSSFWMKNNKLLIVFYNYEKDKTVGQYEITNTILYEIPEEDLPTVIQDWETIIGKVRNGKAHELSEGDTFYLGACTKGKDSSSLRQQPFSDISAMQRAYSFKQSYMTHILRSNLNNEFSEKLIKDGNFSIRGYVEKLLKPFINKSYEELCEVYGQASCAKNSVQLLISKIFNIKGTDLSKIQEFEKANLKLKTITVDKNNKIKESMSFPTFKFKEIIETSWEESDLKRILGEQKYLFIVFKENKTSDLIFKGFRFWNIPYEDLNEVERVYRKTVEVIKAGVEIKEKLTKNGIRHNNNLPSKSESYVCHVRPHGRDARDTYELPDGRRLTKQCFWLNNTYILEQVKDLFYK